MGPNLRRAEAAVGGERWLAETQAKEPMGRVRSRRWRLAAVVWAAWALDREARARARLVEIWRRKSVTRGGRPAGASAARAAGVSGWWP